MNIVYVVEFPFPYGTAGSMRTRNLCRLIELAGHRVHIISDYASQGEGQEEFSCEAIYDKTSFIRRRTVPYKCVAKLKGYLKKNKIDCVVSSARFERVAELSRLCQKNNIKFIIEHCEWYDFSTFKFGKYNPNFMKNEKMIRNDFKEADGFISISRLLNEHNSHFAQSVRIPTILDVENTAFNSKTDNEKIKIVYTGNPGKKKEFLAPLCRVLGENKEFKERFEFHIYGPTKEMVLTNIGSEEILKKAGESVVIHGRIPQKEIEGVLKSADYLIFLRPQRRSSDAGFPTKLGESFAVGTPVIANDTGDLSLYIKNDENGFLLNTCEDDELKEVLVKISEKSGEDYQKMRKSARKTAEECFDYRRYTEEIEKILK